MKRRIKHAKVLAIGFRWKLMLSYLLIVIVAMGAFFMSVVSMSNQHHRKMAETMFDNVVDSAYRQARHRVDAVERALLLLTQDQSLTRIMNVDYISHFDKAQDVLNILDPIISLLYSNYHEFVGYEIYTKGGISGARNNFIPFEKADENARARNAACAVEPLWQYEAGIEDALVKTYLTVSRKCVYQGTLEDSAVVTLYINGDILFNDVMPDNGLPLAVEMADAQGTPFFRAGDCEESGADVYGAQRRMAGTGWLLTVRMDASGMMLSTPDLIYLPLYVFIIVLVMLLLVSVLLSRRFFQRIQRLQMQLRQVVPSAFEIDISDDTPDEVGDIANSVGDMIRETRSVLLEGYHNRIARREAQIIALQAQINPHFLFNTLSNLNWRVLKRGDEEMSGIITRLSKFYFMSLNDGKQMSTVRGEINHMDMYLKIQEAIRGVPLTVIREVDEAALEMSMPGVILQPLAENALEHGIGAVGFDKGKLWLSVKLREENVEISLRDNGPGIPDEVIRCLHTDAKLGYGLRNVDRRLRLYYGDAYGLEFPPSPEGGALILLRIPREG